MDAGELREVLAFAVAAAREAGAFTLAYFQTEVTVEQKKDGTPVTIADRGAEERLRRRIETAFPTHAIVGEELGEKPGTAPARWILDPIDGTFSFISGVPLYSVLVGLEWAGEMVLGVLHLPALGETVYAARALGCWWDGRRAHVSDTRDLARARVSATSTKLLQRHGRLAAYARLRAACAADRGWPDAYAYACLATGRVDIVLDPIMNLWDTAALEPIVTEAGGTFTDWSGRPTHAAPEVLATNGWLLEETLITLRGSAPG